MLTLILALLAQDPTPDRGPYVDLSTGTNGLYADKASIRTDHGRVRLIVTAVRPDQARSERDYWFDCAAGTYSSATWRTLNAAGEVEMHAHVQMRPAHRPVTDDVEPFRALACDGDDGGRPILAELPR